MIETKNSRMDDSQKLEVISVHGYQKLAPGTMTSQGNCTALAVPNPNPVRRRRKKSRVEKARRTPVKALVPGGTFCKSVDNENTAIFASVPPLLWIEKAEADCRERNQGADDERLYP